MGVPETDRPLLGELAHRVQGFDDPELGGGSGGENTAAIHKMSSYALDLGRERRRAPRDDIATAILEAEVEGYAMDDAAFASVERRPVTPRFTVRRYGRTTRSSSGIRRPIETKKSFQPPSASTSSAVLTTISPSGEVGLTTASVPISHGSR